MKKLVIAILVLVAFLSCSKSKSSLPSGSPKEVLSNDLFAQLSAKYDSIADFEFGYAVVKKGKVMFEVGEVSEEIAREALRLAMHKLPIKCKFVKKEGVR